MCVCVSLTSLSLSGTPTGGSLQPAVRHRAGQEVRRAVSRLRAQAQSRPRARRRPQPVQDGGALRRLRSVPARRHGESARDVMVTSVVASAFVTS